MGNGIDKNMKNVIEDDIKEMLLHVKWNRNFIGSFFDDEVDFQMIYHPGPNYKLSDFKKNIGYRNMSNIIIENWVRESMENKI